VTGALAPVLGRITEIAARFGGGVIPGPLDATPSAANSAVPFDAAYDLASAELSLVGSTGQAGVGWTGVGSSGWVVPGAGGGVPSLSPSPYLAVAAGSVPADTPFANQFEAAAARHGVPPKLLAAVGWVESRYQTNAVSGAGAQGVMQLMPFVSEAYGVNPWDPAQAIDAAARILSEHHARFGSWDLALAAYNAGAGAVSRAGNQPPSARVAGYVSAVNQRIEQM